MPLDDIIYYGCDALGVVAAFVYAWVVLPRYGISRGKGIALTLMVYAFSYVLMLLLYWLVTGYFGGQNYVRAFVFVPFIAMLLSSAMGVDWRAALDLAAPIMCFSMFTGKLGCIYCGCCYSWLQVDWGIYNPDVHATLFPVQLFEGLTALAIAVWLAVRAARRGYKADGTGMWLMLIVFGLTRFGWEFLRDNDKLFCGVSELALWALAMVVVGAVALGIRYTRVKKVVAAAGDEVRS